MYVWICPLSLWGMEQLNLSMEVLWYFANRWGVLIPFVIHGSFPLMSNPALGYPVQVMEIGVGVKSEVTLRTSASYDDFGSLVPQQLGLGP